MAHQSERTALASGVDSECNDEPIWQIAWRVVIMSEGGEARVQDGCVRSVQ